MKRKERSSTYGPDLTDRMRKELEAEIRRFDEKKTLREIERASQHKPSAEYETINEIDYLNEDKVRPIVKPALDKEVEMAKFEIDEILTYRQKQVWRLCMRQGKSQEEAAHQLRMTQQTVAEHLELAEKRIRKHFEEKGKTNEQL